MVTMTTFDESLHPRGQAGNAGQFAMKTNDAPTGDLAVPVSAEQAWSTRRQALDTASYYAQNAANQAAVERMFAELGDHIPEGATHIEVTFNEDDVFEGVQPRGHAYVDADGDEIDVIDEDLELYDINSDTQMEIAGFVQQRDDTGGRTERWRIPVRPAAEPPAPHRLPAHGAFQGSARVGRAGTGMAELLLSAAARDPETAAALDRLDSRDFGVLAVDFDEMVTQMRDRIQKLGDKAD